MPPVRLMIGLMSGTSADAIDAAIVRIDGPASAIRRVETLQHLEHPWPAKLRARLLAAMAPAATTTQEICELNALVAHEFAAAVESVLRAAKIPRNRITAIGSHGQTVCHLPPKIRNPSSKNKNRPPPLPSTLQLGDPSIIATLTGLATVGNFRPADMAVGGQGAPLVPWTDAALLRDSKITRCVQNIGGMANVTYLPRENARPTSRAAQQNKILAFDTGPGNVLMDAVVTLATAGRRRYDRNGALASRGTVNAPLLRELTRHPYFVRRPPKSTGREDFGAPLAQQLYNRYVRTQKLRTEDLLATLTRFTAWSIADAYVRHLPQPPQEVVLCGGGADNPVLMHHLALELLHSRFAEFPPIQIRRIDDFGIPNKAKEAVSFALLALATLDGVAGNLPSVTGAARPVVLGVTARPSV